ncbi:MAG TPA: response regulator [Fimbriimonadaceae bacterium]|nr:response regulator [Fimbriimonadaceae bacterium]
MSKRILISDDAMFMRNMLKNILIVEGYAIYEASNGEEAVKAYASYQPDLVFMDLTMPVMDGITAIKHIMGSDPNAKIIVCSALGQKNMVIEAIQAGARDYIVKPFDKARVVDGAKAQIGSGKAA